jgi:hypothetical protein
MPNFEEAPRYGMAHESEKDNSDWSMEPEIVAHS